jgi:hypothetical protein
MLTGKDCFSGYLIRAFFGTLFRLSLIFFLSLIELITGKADFFIFEK